MKDRLDVPKGRPLADFLPTITIKAKDFANEITNFNVKRDDTKEVIRGRPSRSEAERLAWFFLFMLTVNFGVTADAGWLRVASN